MHPNTMNRPIGSGILAGFKEFALKPILLGIGLFIFIYSGISTFVYFEIKNILIDVDPDSRTQIWAGIDLAVNVLAVLTGLVLEPVVWPHDLV